VRPQYSHDLFRAEM